jgi:cell division cycle 14
MGVTTVIRLNKPNYDAEKFKKNGIKHIDLFFLDGSNPPKDVVEKFF